MAGEKSVTGFRRSTRVARKSWTKSLFGLSSRIVLWYTLATVLLRCPSSVGDVTEQSPAVCRAYFDARSQVVPLIEPYYEAYAAPYVNFARPYAEVFESKVYTPGATLAKQQYEKHGAHRVAQGWEYFLEQWKNTAAPHVDSIQAYLNNNYETMLKPYVNQATRTAGPYVKTAHSIAVHQYHATVIPLYTKALPWAENVYNRGQRFALETALPYGRWAGLSSFNFVTRKMWPTIRVLYGENIEPQVLRIRERLASYRDGKKLEAAVDAMISPSSLSISDLFKSTTIETSATESAAAPTMTVFKTSSAIETMVDVLPSAVDHNDMSQQVFDETMSSSSSNPTTGEVPQPSPSVAMPKYETATEKPLSLNVSEELKLWEEKFTRACEIGKADLQERVDAITSRQIEHQVKGLGEAFLTQLEEAARSALSHVQTAILKAVNNLPEDPSDVDYQTAEEQVHLVVRSAAGSVKGRAQDLRSWKVKFDKDTHELAEAALESTLHVVDHIRDLGLQEIGMRWASMPEVTYKDWAAYYALKKSVDQWRSEVHSVTLEHTGLVRAKSEGEDIEAKGMAIAEETAKELAQLKKVARSKLAAKDSSDDFSTSTMSSMLDNVGGKVQKGLSSMSETLIGTATAVSSATDFQKSVKSAENDVSDEPRDASIVSTASTSGQTASTPVPDPAPSVVEFITDSLAAAIETVTEQASEIFNDVTASLTSTTEGTHSTIVNAQESYARMKPFAQSVLSAPKFKITGVSERIIGSPQPPTDNTKIQDEIWSSGEWAKSTMSVLANTADQALPVGTVAPSAGGISQPASDIVSDGSYRASMSIRSAIAKAGTAYADVTNSLASALRKSRDDEPHNTASVEIY